jgi:hypothetical protein
MESAFIIIQTSNTDSVQTVKSDTAQQGQSQIPQDNGNII